MQPGKWGVWVILLRSENQSGQILFLQMRRRVKEQRLQKSTQAYTHTRTHTRARAYAQKASRTFKNWGKMVQIGAAATVLVFVLVAMAIAPLNAQHIAADRGGVEINSKPRPKPKPHAGQLKEGNPSYRESARGH